MQDALSGVKILDLSRILAGPWCTQNLADLGADVVKVESVETGDDTRGWGPPFLTAEGQDPLSAYFLCCNRGKRSIAIDFAKPEGAALVKRLAARCDVVIENFKSGSLLRFGLDYASLRAINPRLIQVSITGFGQDGPMAGRPGYDYVFQGMAGLMSYTGIPDGQAGAGPLRTGVAVVDLMTGLYATIAVQAALRERERSGQGQHIDLALLDVGVALNANQATNYLVSGKAPARSGNAHPNCAPYEVFACRDGHMILAIGNDAQFERFCAVAGRDDLGRDARYRTNAGRIENLPALREEVARILARKDRQDWGRMLDAVGVPWGPIQPLNEVFADAQVRHRQINRTLRHPRMGAIPSVRNPLLPPVAGADDGRPPPLLGEHTEEVLAELGLGATEMAALRSGKVIA
ncbi:CaiB/BaiF CoA transferase family protein [Phreatobacter stygius]|uniref:CaiB/BaiF CoA transferase family protein n=1 Tax=Phreatobacter stygius TaxID=1940610 RepID=UPI001C07DB8C|nr:CaiB/BaiF CoA-transferase family protein [Phreatobacter stygius]